MGINGKRSTKFPEKNTFWLTLEQKVQMRRKGIRPDHFRSFIENYGGNGKGNKELDSNDWQELRNIIDRVPSIQIVGDVNSGKTFLVRSLVKNDRNRVYIVMDAHNEFDFLPTISNITTDIKQSCRIKLPDQPGGAVGLFGVYYNLIMNNQFPKNYVLVVEEALRYKDVGLKNLMAEARKFIFVMAIMQEKMYDFVPAVGVRSYNPVKI